MSLSRENERRLTWQMLFLIIFFGIAIPVHVIQFYHMPDFHGRPMDAMEYNRQRERDFMTKDIFLFDPYDENMTFIEAGIVLVFYFYGILRLVNIMRIIIEDDKERQWEFFWELCDSQR